MGIIDNLTEPSYFTEAGRHEPLARQLLAQLGSRRTSELRRVVFCILKPDLLASGKALEALDWLECAGYSVVDARVCPNTHPRQFEQLYQYNLTLQNELNQLLSWWLNTQVFTYGPLVTLMLRREADQDRTAHAQLAQVKGPSSPYEGRSGELRYELRATNRSLNLIHVADDPWSTAREYLIFHPLTDLAATLEHSSRAEVLRGQAACNFLGELLNLMPNDCVDLGFVATIVRVKARLRHVMLASGAKLPDDNLIALYRDYHELARAQVSIIEQAVQFHSLMAKEAAELQTVRADQASDQLNSFRMLAAYDQLGDDVATRCEGTFDGNRIFLGPWERLVLRTSLHYADELPGRVSDHGDAAPILDVYRDDLELEDE